MMNQSQQLMNSNQHTWHTTTGSDKKGGGKDPGPGRGRNGQNTGHPDLLSYYNPIFRKSSLYVLLKLGRNFTASFPVRELSRTLQYDVSIISKNLTYLEERALVRHERRGNLMLYRANMDNVLLRQMKVFFTLLELNDLIQAVCPVTSNLILFGSCSTGEDTESSDIDLFIETTNKNEVRSAIQTFQEKITRTVSPLLVTPDELYTMKLKDPALYSSIHQGMVVHGGSYDL